MAAVQVGFFFPHSLQLAAALCRITIGGRRHSVICKLETRPQPSALMASLFICRDGETLGMRWFLLFPTFLFDKFWQPPRYLYL